MKGHFLPGLVSIMVLGVTSLGLISEGFAQKSSTPVIPGSNSKDPTNITADKAEYFDKEQLVVYTGNVVAVQGPTTLKASVLHIHLEKKEDSAKGKDSTSKNSGAATTNPAGPSASTIRSIDADGPVTVISADQVATGDNGTYDKQNNKLFLKGNVTLSQGTSVSKGDALEYNLTTGQAVLTTNGKGAGVSSLFAPSSGGDNSANKPKKLNPQ